MTRRSLSTLVASLCLVSTQAADPQIQNVSAAQRPGSYIVDIAYDVIDPDSPTVYIFVEISANGGTTYAIPGFPASGDIGHVIPGANKRIVWNAWVNWAGNFTETAKVRVTAVETTTIAPDPGFPAPSPRMTWIPAGTFSRGARNVWVSQGFWMGKYEVTQSEYESVMASNPSQFRGPNRPVEMVRWAEARTYCQNLTTIERAAGRLPANWEYRLPTEAQWELACVGGVDGDVFFGANPTPTVIQGFAWFSSPSSADVGQKAPNPYSLYDVYGNVWEYTLDGWSEIGGGNFMDPFVPSGNSIVMRGAGFSDTPGAMNSRIRSSWNATDRAQNIGFRVVAVQLP